MTGRRRVWMFDEAAFGRGWLGSTQRHFALARVLREHGWDVTLVLANRFAGNQPDIEAAFPGAVIRTPFTVGPWPRCCDHRFVVRLWLGTTRLRRNRQELLRQPERSWATKVMDWIGDEPSLLDPPDVVWGVSYGRLTSLVTAKAVSERTGAQLVVALHDPVPRPGGALTSAERDALAATVRAAAAIVVTTRSYAEQVQAQFPEAAEKIEVVYASYRPEDVVLPEAADSDRSTGCFTVLYAGSLYGGQLAGIRAFVRSLARCVERRPDLREKALLRLIGGGRGGDQASELAESLGLEGMVVTEDQVTPEEVAEATGRADCLLLVEWESGVQIPGKLFRYLPAGKPILAVSRDGEVAEILARSGLGVVVPGDNLEAISAAIENLIDAWSTGHPAVHANAEYIGLFSERNMGIQVSGLLSRAIQPRMSL